MPHTGADQTFASGEEEGRSEEDIGLGGMREIDGGGIEVERDSQNNDQADGMSPDVHRLVREIKSGFDAVDLIFRESIAPGDVRIDSPWVR